MSDVKAVSIKLTVEVPETLDMADLARYIHKAARAYSEHLHVLRVGVKTITQKTTNL